MFDIYVIDILVTMCNSIEITLANSSIKAPTVINGGYLLYCPKDSQIKKANDGNLSLDISIKIPNGYYGRIENMEPLFNMGIFVFGELVAGSHSNITLKTHRYGFTDIDTKTQYNINIKKDTVVGKLIIREIDTPLPLFIYKN